jgi:hypothetical protein
VPEVLHAELELDGVLVDASAVLPGDGFTDYTKAFRTVEDLHVNAAVAGYLASVAARYDFPKAIAERLGAVAASLCLVARLDAKDAETHVVLAGILADLAAVAAETEPLWSRVGDAERDRWYRDRALTLVASKARDTRRERAWEVLEGKK